MVGRYRVQGLQEQLDELFEDVWRGPRLATRPTGFRPRVDVYVTEEPRELTIVLELAGLDPENLELTLIGDLLVVAGSRDHVGTDCDCTISWYQAEIARGPFEWRVRLPANADPSASRATYANGLLTIVLPLAATPPPRGPVSIPIASTR